MPKFISTGPAESIIYGPRILDTLDSEEVCWPTKSAFMFVYNGCPAPVAVNITVSGMPLICLPCLLPALPPSTCVEHQVLQGPTILACPYNKGLWRE